MLSVMERANSTGSWLTREICGGGRMGCERPGTRLSSCHQEPRKPWAWVTPGALGLKSDQGPRPAAAFSCLSSFRTVESTFCTSPQPPWPANWGPAKLAALGPVKLPDLQDGAYWLPLTWKERERKSVECNSVSQPVPGGRQEGAAAPGHRDLPGWCPLPVTERRKGAIVSWSQF